MCSYTYYVFITESEVADLRNEIGQLKAQLVQEKQTRKNKEEYDVMAKTVNKVKSRRETQK